MSARGDVVGGAVAAAISLPEALALGGIAFAPLGPAGAAAGALSGLVTLVAHNFVAGLVPGVRPMTAGVYSLTSLMLAAAVDATHKTGNDALVAVTGISLAAGVCQILLALLRVGSLVKYIPYPVVAGLVNGTAVLIVLRYAAPAVGIDADLPTLVRGLIDGRPPDGGGGVALHTGALVVGLSVVAASLLMRKLPRVPGPLVGLVVGTAVYWVARGRDLDVGDVLDANLAVSVASVLPPLAFPALELWPYAFGVAAVASLRTLIVTVALDRTLPPTTVKNATATRELIAQGVGNTVASLCGGVPAAAYVTSSIVALQTGAGSRALRLWTALFAALALFAAQPLAHTLPRTAIAAMLVVFALGMFDPWSLRLLKGFVQRRADAHHALGDVITVVAVAALLAFVGIFEAVGVGFAIALVGFVARQSRPPLRRSYNAERVRSYVERPAREVAALELVGARVQVFELQGALFFGGADFIADRVDEALAAGARYVLLDLERVSDVDSTAAHVLARAARAAANESGSGGGAGPGGARLVLSSVPPGSRIDATLSAAGVWSVATRQPSHDAALAVIEDSILDDELGTERYDRDTPLSEIDALRFLANRSGIAPYLEDVHFHDGAPLFAMGDTGDALFFLVRGRVVLEVSARPSSKPPVVTGSLNLAELEALRTLPRRRIAVLCPGTVLGELALLDGRPRAAHASALGAVRCWKLSRARFTDMKAERPDIAAALMEGLAAELAKRVRIANRHATELRA